MRRRHTGILVHDWFGRRSVPAGNQTGSTPLHSNMKEQPITYPTQNIVIIQRAVEALVFELVAPPLEQIYTKPKQLGLVLENPYM